MTISRILASLFGSESGQPVIERPLTRSSFMVQLAKLTPESAERKAFLAKNRHFVLNGGANTFGWSAPENTKIVTPEDFSQVKCTVFIRNDGSVGAAGGLFNRVRLDAKLFEIMTREEQEAHIFNTYRNEIDGRSAGDIVDDVIFDEETQKWKIVVDKNGNPDVNGAIRQNALGRETGEEHRDLGKSDLAKFLDPSKTVWDTPSVDDAFILRWNPHKDGDLPDADVIAASQAIFAVDASCGANRLTTEEMAIIEKSIRKATPPLIIAETHLNLYLSSIHNVIPPAHKEMGGMIVENLLRSLTRLHDGAPGVEKADSEIYRYPHEYFRKWILAAQLIDAPTTEKREEALTNLASAVQLDISMKDPKRKLSFDVIAVKTGKSVETIAQELSISREGLSSIQFRIDQIATNHLTPRISPDRHIS